MFNIVCRGIFYRNICALLFSYSSSSNDAKMMVRSFVDACYLHSKRHLAKDNNDIGETVTQEADDGLRFCDKDVGVNNTFSNQETRSLEEFIDDLCTNFIEYGAQYEAFVRIVRVFFAFPFPSSVITSLIRKLRGVLHLLTHEEESSDIGSNDVFKELRCALSKSCSGFKVIESYDILDSFAAILAKSTDSNSRAFDLGSGGFFYLLAVASLSRNMIMFILYHFSHNGMREAVHRRLKGLCQEAFKCVILVTGQYVRQLKEPSRSKNDLDEFIAIFFDVCVHGKSMKSVGGDLFDPSSEFEWKEFLIKMSNILE